MNFSFQDSVYNFFYDLTKKKMASKISIVLATAWGKEQPEMTQILMKRYNQRKHGMQREIGLKFLAELHRGLL